MLRSRFAAALTALACGVTMTAGPLAATSFAHVDKKGKKCKQFKQFKKGNKKYKRCVKYK